MGKRNKLTWGDFYSEESICNNERLMRKDGSYNHWDERNNEEWDHLYDYQELEYIHKNKIK